MSREEVTRYQWVCDNCSSSETTESDNPPVGWLAGVELNVQGVNALPDDVDFCGSECLSQFIEGRLT